MHMATCFGNYFISYYRQYTLFSSLSKTSAISNNFILLSLQFPLKIASACLTDATVIVSLLHFLQGILSRNLWKKIDHTHTQHVQESGHSLKYNRLKKTWLSFGSLPRLPLGHLLIGDFFSRHAAKFINVDLVQFGQKIFHPLISDGTYCPDVHPWCHQHVVKENPIQFHLLVEQLGTKRTEKGSFTVDKGRLNRDDGTKENFNNLTDDDGWMWIMEPWPSIVQNTFPIDLGRVKKKNKNIPFISQLLNEQQRCLNFHHVDFFPPINLQIDM